MYEVSIVLITDGNLIDLERCLNNVYNQTYQNYELIIINRSLKREVADSVGILNLKKSNINYIEIQGDYGKLFNIGIFLSRGKYLTFLYDNSFWIPETLDTLYKWCSIGMDAIVALSKVKNKNNEYHTENFEWKKGEIKKDNPITLSSCIFSKELFFNVGGFFEEDKNEILFWNKIFSKEILKIGKIEEILSVSNKKILNRLKSKNKISDEDGLLGIVGRRHLICIKNKEISDIFNSRNHDIVSIVKKTKEVEEFVKINNKKIIKKINCKSVKDILESSESSIVNKILMDIFFKKSLKIKKNIERNYLINQLNSSDLIDLSQNVALYIKTDKIIKGISIFLSRKNNNIDKVNCEISVNLGDSIIKQIKTIPYYKLSDGWNDFIFNIKKIDKEKDIIFRITSDNNSYQIHYNKATKTNCVMLVGNAPIKSCLKFRIF